MQPKAAKLVKRDNQFARAAECYGRAAAAAAQLTGGNDCLIVAALRRYQYVSLVEHMMNRTFLATLSAIVIEEEEDVQNMCAELLSEVITVVERRKAAGTLLSVTETEKSWYFAHMNSESGTAAGDLTGDTLGYELFLRISHAAVCHLFRFMLKTPNLILSTEVAPRCFKLVPPAALDMIGDTVALDGTPSGAAAVFMRDDGRHLSVLSAETVLVDLFYDGPRASDMQRVLRRACSPELIDPLFGAWERLRSGPAFAAPRPPP